MLVSLRFFGSVLGSSACQTFSLMGKRVRSHFIGFAWPSAPLFFNTVRTHVMEGLFADPVYGGNKNFEGWRQISFPGGQPFFTAQDMQSREAFTRAPIVGIQARANGTVRGG